MTTAGKWCRAACLIICVLVALVLTFWARHQEPPSTLIKLFSPIPAEEAAFSLPEGAPAAGAPDGWWCLRLDLDHPTAVDHDWSMVEDQPLAYELQWIATQRLFRLVRHGDGPQLLGSIRIDAPPRRVLWKRSGDTHEVLVDNRRILRCLDLLPHPGGRTWRLNTQADLGRSRLYLLNRRHLEPSEPEQPGLSPPTPAPGRPEDDSWYVRHIISQRLRALIESPAAVRLRIFDEIKGDIVLLGRDPDFQSQARAWLNWVVIASMIRGQEFDPFALSQSFYSFGKATASTAEGTPPPQPPQTIGVLMDFVTLLIRRAEHLPREELPVRRMVQQRRETLNLIAATCDIILALHRQKADSGRHMLTPEDRYDLQLIRHAARMLAGFAPEATPTDYPDWVVCRWRMLAGSLPIELPLEDLPYSPKHPPILRPAMKRLLAMAHLEEADTVRMRARLLSAVANRELPDGLDAILETELPERARLAARLILVAAGELPPEPLVVLLKENQTARDLLKTDPLIYALARLAAHRRETPELTPAVTLQIDFTTLPATIPPEEGIAAALAIQEVSGDAADWTLLESYPSLKLPLGLLVPKR